jgi:hypothetical protein
MIDNMEIIKPLLSFDPEHFYYIEIMQRKKENPEIGSNTRIIKQYFINSLKYLESHYEEMKKLCNLFNARAGIRMNKRNAKQVSLKTLQIIADHAINDAYHCSKSAYAKACGQCHHDSEKKWIVDIDVKDWTPHVNLLAANIQGERLGKVTLYAVVPSLAGRHLITSPFNMQAFRLMGFKEDVHKDNPTNLYIP